MDLDMKINLDSGKVYKEPTDKQKRHIAKLVEYFDHDIDVPKDLSYDEAKKFIRKWEIIKREIENFNPDDYDVPF